MRLVTRRRTIEFPRLPLLMGIVNLGADSFSGDGLPEPSQAVARAEQLIADGAEIIDIGAESARTNRSPISTNEEVDRFGAFLKLWDASPARETLLSLNTWRPEVVRQVLPHGGDLVNDISGLPDPENARACAQAGAALLVMHTLGEPKIPHTHVRYDDVMETLEHFFAGAIERAQSAGLSRDALLLDPGLDFAKQQEDNLRILRELRRLHRFERPILLPISRKTFIGEVLAIDEPAQRDAGTMACLVQGMLEEAHVFRVHNVRAANQALRTIASVMGGPAAAS